MHGQPEPPRHGSNPKTTSIKVAVSVMDASTAQVLRAKLEALDGIERVVVDEATSTVLIHCSADSNATSLAANIDAAIAAAGLETGSVNLKLLTDLAARRRVKFSKVE